MSSWDKMDKVAWNESEVMQEFEKKILESAYALAADLEKRADLKSLPGDLAKVNQQAPAAAKSISDVANATSKLYGNADDGEDKDSSEKIEKAEDALKDIADETEEVVDKLANLLEELTKLSYYIADEGDTELAYKLERVIRDIEAGSDED